MWKTRIHVRYSRFSVTKFLTCFSLQFTSYCIKTLAQPVVTLKFLPNLSEGDEVEYRRAPPVL